MDRLERVRRTVDRILREQADEREQLVGFVHLYSVSQACALLALRRGLDVQLCTVAGMLHDIATYKTSDSTNHGPRSALEARQILDDSQAFAEPEIAALCQAIERHSRKEEIHEPMDELLKDADVLQHYLYNPGFAQEARNRTRLRSVLDELGFPINATRFKGTGSSEKLFR
jgi:uncharacterized protein